MANILISCASNPSNKTPGVFYEGLEAALIKNGNNVLHINAMHYLKSCYQQKPNMLRSDYNEQALLKKIQGFKPDLIIAFNNYNLPFEDKFDCPIIVWEADTVIYYNDQDKLKKNQARYHFFAFIEKSVQDIKNRFNADKVFYVPLATAINALDIPQDKNISFLGSCFDTTDVVVDNISFFNEQNLKLLKEYFNDLSRDPTHHSVKENIFSRDSGDIISHLSTERRVKVLNAVSDLGLSIYGNPPQWANAFSMFSNLAFCLQTKPVFTLAENEWLYNSSKIDINVNHIQANSGFGWRALDIMASNGCLLTEYTPGMSDFKQIKDFAFYDNEYHARELATKLLKEDSLRKDIVLASQELVNKSYRWSQRLKEIEQILSVKICDVNQSTGTLEYLNPEDYFTSARNFKKKIISVKKKVLSDINQSGFIKERKLNKLQQAKLELKRTKRTIKKIIKSLTK